MKLRPLYKILFMALVLWCWTTGYVNARTNGENPRTVAEPASPGAAPQPAGAQSPEDSSAILERKAAAMDETPVRSVRLATQELGLKLIGTVVANDPEDSMAIIEDRTTGKQYPRREGDRVGKALIKKILRNEVIINAGRGDKMLTMLHEQPSSRGGPLNVAAASPLAGAVTIGRLERAEVERTVPEYRDFMRTVRVRPHRQGGRPGGFMIYNIEPDSIFSKMGLENGDVIRAVNGQAIKNTQEALVFYNGLKAGGAVTLDIQRGESEQELRVDIQ